MKRVRLSIEGMNCASCAVNIERAIRSTEGIIEANVNFASGRASIKYDRNTITLEGIKKDFRFGV